MSNITIVGCGYVGLVTGAVLSKLGNKVVGVDIDSERIAKLNAGICPIYEPGLMELINEQARNGKLRFTTKYEDAIPDSKFVFICVNTPPSPHGGADMRFVRNAAREIGRNLSVQHKTIVINKSTMPPGSGDMVEAILSEEAEPEAEFAVVANPEFLREGSALQDMLNPDRIVLGSKDQEAAEAVASLYSSFTCPILLTNIRTAEMIKYAANAFLAMKISFINEMAQICEAIGADVRQVSTGIGLDKRIGTHFLQAGIGFGGSCFPKDAQALEYVASISDCYPRILKAVLEVNRESRRRFVTKIDKVVGGLYDKTVGVWGLAFKANTDDIREAPALDIIPELLSRGANVKVYDPAAMENARRILPERVSFCEDVYTVAENAHVLAIITDWEQFRSVDLTRVKKLMATHKIVDGRNIFDPELVRGLGFEYVGIGIPFCQSESERYLPQASIPIWH